MKKIKDSIIVIGEAITEYYYFNSLKDTYRQLNIRPTYPKHSSGLDYLKQEIDKAIDAGYSQIICVVDMDNKKEGKGTTPTPKWQSCLRRWESEQGKIGIKLYLRFVMNSQLVTAGYPWVVIPVERREEYMAALEQANEGGVLEGDLKINKMRNYESAFQNISSS